MTDSPCPVSRTFERCSNFSPRYLRPHKSKLRHDHCITTERDGDSCALYLDGSRGACNSILSFHCCPRWTERKCAKQLKGNDHTIEPEGHRKGRDTWDRRSDNGPYICCDDHLYRRDQIQYELVYDR